VFNIIITYFNKDQSLILFVGDFINNNMNHRPIDLTKWPLIKDYFKDKVELFPYPYNKLSLILTPLETEWLAQQILPDIELITKKKHKIHRAIIFMQPPNLVGGVHVDGIHPERTNNVNWAVNIPLTNTPAEMFWYNGEYKLILKDGDRSGVPYLTLDWLSKSEIDETIIVDKPVIIYIEKPHNAKNLTDEIRLILTVRFTPDLFE
jgi:hypothetical protein